MIKSPLPPTHPQKYKARLLVRAEDTGSAGAPQVALAHAVCRGGRGDAAEDGAMTGSAVPGPVGSARGGVVGDSD